MALLILIGLGMFAVSKTGLVNVPFFSRWYRTPQPSRLIISSTQTLESSVAAQIKKQTEAIARNPNGSKTFSLILPEEELTRTFHDFLATSFKDMTVEQAQVAIDPGVMEWYVRFRKDSQQPVITLRMQPVLEQDGIKLRVLKVELGTLPIWHRVVEALLDRALADTLAQINKNILAISELQSVTLRSGSIEAVGILKLPVHNE